MPLPIPKPMLRVPGRSVGEHCVRYISTRGKAPPLGFEEVMLSGLAPDGGLYMPEEWPRLLDATLFALRGAPYGEVAFRVMAPFIGDAVPEAELRRMIAGAYGSFAHAAVTPLVQLAPDHWLLELFHGPTLAFKDVAMQLLVRLLDGSLERRSDRATLVCATSGDTGAAAVEAFKNSAQCSLFVLHPHGRVSEVQRRQMTTVNAPSVHNVAIEGNFDDCQAIVKALFADRAFRAKVKLSGVNSINWARLLAQAVYYVYAGLSLGAPLREMSFCVPTGNFGNVFAAYVAWKLGLPVERLIVATNANNILHRVLTTGRYERAGVMPTMSPSMDIEVSSNFERLLFDASDRDPALVRKLMTKLSETGSFALPAKTMREITRRFTSGSTDETATLAAIASAFSATGELLDPHTAVAYAVAAKTAGRSGPKITLSTAHPAKFPDAVEKACGVRPRLPSRLAGLLDRREAFDLLPNDVETVKQHILTRSDR
jgi:threonine synthase